MRPGGERAEVAQPPRGIAARGGDRATRLTFLEVADQALRRDGAAPRPVWLAELRARVERGAL